MMNRLLLALPTVSALLTVPASLTAGSPPRAAEPMLVADFAPGDVVEDGLRMFPNPAVRLGETIFFTARSPATGFELWASDGSEAGTAVVRDLCPGPCDANPRRLTAVGDAAVYFVADAGEPRLFRSDGTRAGTLPVLGACPGGRCFSDPRILAAAGDRLVFTARGADGALGLWVTDGTRPGTRPIAPPAGGCALESVDEAVTAGERVTLDARCAGGGEALWAVDGGEARELFRGQEVWNQVPAEDGRVVFLGSAFEHGVWVTDGTPGGTAALPSPGFDCGPPAAILGVHAGGSVDVVTGGRGFSVPLVPRCLWAVAAGAEPVRLFGDGVTYQAAWELGVAAARDRFFFLAAEPDPDGGRLDVQLALWVSDGTPGGTRPVMPLVAPGPFATLGDRLVFADAGGLYASDGTPAGTVRFAEGEMRTPAALGDRLFFGRQDEAGLQVGGTLQPWLTDGTAAGTARLAVVGAGHASGEPRAVTGLGEALLFSAGTAADAALWRADGKRLVELSELPGGAVERFLDGGRVIFSGPDSLVATDGTPAGTVVLSTAGWGGRGFARFGGNVYFAAWTPTQGFELWRSDGTAAGTALFVEMDDRVVQSDPPYPLQGDPSDLTVLGNRLVFAAWSEEPGRELWVSDGSAAGTAPLVDLCPGACDAHPAELTRLPGAPGRALFSATDGQSGRELWRTDGTAAGTRRVADLVPGPAGSAPHGLTAFGNGVVFFAASPNGGEALWASDGTAARTRRIADLSLGGEAGLAVPRPPAFPAAGDRAPARAIVVAGGLLYFVAEHPSTGAELWASDGTAAGTGLVRDLDPGRSPASPDALTAVDGRLVFAAEESVHGRELWASDGTEAGTRLLADLAPGAASSSPADLGVASRLIGFRADDGTTGRELWTLGRAAAAEVLAAGRCRPAARALCLADGRFEVEVRFRDPNRGGAERAGFAVPLTDETGAFWFFAEANLELLVKVIDGREVDGSFWVFAGGLTDVEHRIIVTDTLSGEVRELHQPAGRLGGLAATGLFPDSAVRGRRPRVAAPPAAPPCGGDPAALCLRDGRFAVKVTFRDPNGVVAEGVGRPVAGTADTGFFWFFAPQNLEIAVKVLDGRAINGHFWVFRGGLTQVEHTLEVRDRVTGEVRTYHHRPGALGGEADVAAF